MINKIYQNANDKNVAAKIVYDGGDYYAYSDANLEHCMTREELLDAFFKGCIICDLDNTFYKPHTAIADSDSQTDTKWTELLFCGSDMSSYMAVRSCEHASTSK